MSTEAPFQRESHEAFEAALVAVMDYFKGLLTDERAKVADLEARIAEMKRERDL